MVNTKQSHAPTTTRTTTPRIQRALISVSDKTALLPLAQTLIAQGIEIISTGGSAQALQNAGIAVREVSSVTEFPEMMSGRVKTLHPKIHGAILARRDLDLPVCKEYDIAPIDLVIVNLYPFQKVISAEHTLADAIENIDIGGPAMIRSAAKNHAWVTVICDPTDYAAVQEALVQHDNCLPESLRQQLAKKAFAYTAQYDASIAHYLSEQFTASTHTPFQDSHFLALEKQQDCRYGENPHQKAAIYADPHCRAGDGQLARAVCHQGKVLSYNNFLDAETAWQCVNQFTQQAACVIVKHANPCGVAVAADSCSAYRKAYACDPTSAYGGIVAFNQTLDQRTAETLIAEQFVEVVIAPAIDAAALAILESKPNMRVLTVGPFQASLQAKSLQYLSISGGMLVQTRDWLPLTAADLQTVTQRKATEQQVKDCLFAWHACQFVKSNAIVYAKDGMTIGIGAGQMSRVFSARIAGEKAQAEKLSLSGAVMASDAFFPFSDSIEVAAAMGIVAVIQPGGSKRDAEVIAAADAANMIMIFTGIRHFRH